MCVVLCVRSCLCCEPLQTCTEHNSLLSVVNSLLLLMSAPAPTPTASTATTTSSAGRGAVMFESERLRIRQFHSAAIEAIGPLVLSILNNREVTAVFPPSWQNLNTTEKAESWYADRLTDDGPTFVIERKSDGKAIGFFGTLPVENEWLANAKAKASAERTAKTIATTTAAATATAAAHTTDSKSITTTTTTTTTSTATAAPTSDRLDHTKIELGYMLARDEWDKGYATEATIAAIRYLFTDYRTHTPTTATDSKQQQQQQQPRTAETVFGWTDPAHAPSIKVLSKSGLYHNSEYSHSGKTVLSITKSQWQADHDQQQKQSKK